MPPRLSRHLPRLGMATALALAALAHGLPVSLAQQTSSATASLPFTNWAPGEQNPVFTAEGPGHWDVKIRERGWILREGDAWHLWFTGYDGTRNGIRQLGYATSPDGLHWNRSPENPLCRNHWVEDMMVVKQGDVYYMFAEGVHDRAQLLTSTDRVHWKREGTLDIRYTTGQPLTSGPFGTPTVFVEGGVWYLFYERMDQGVWVASSKERGDVPPKVWTNVQDEPVLKPGPEEYDKQMIAMNQVVKYRGAYYGFYHGSGTASPRVWTTDVARSTDLLHWTKYPTNPIVSGDESSGIVVPDGADFRLYTMHEQVDVYFPRHE